MLPNSSTSDLNPNDVVEKEESTKGLTSSELDLSVTQASESESESESVPEDWETAHDLQQQCEKDGDSDSLSDDTKVSEQPPEDTKAQLILNLLSRIRRHRFCESSHSPYPESRMRLQRQPTLFFLFALVISTANLHTSTAAMVSGFSANDSDRIALLAIKSNIVEDPEGVLSSWNDSFQNFCEWEGVTCGQRHRRVTTLDLSSKGLAGSLSPYVGNLSFLRVLRLQNNTLEGVIPPEIGRLFRLEQLVLNNNSFQGVVPASVSNCTNLISLWLSRNKLVGNILREVSSLSKLKDLIVHFNSFTGGIPPSIGNLTSLGRISAAGNNLGGNFPSHAFGQLKSLSQIGFGSNQIYGTIPPSFYNLSSLAVVGIAENEFTGSLPPEIGLKLPQLQIFEIWGNQFTGLLPISLSNSSELASIDVGDNNFHGKMAIEFGMLPNLWKVVLFDNNFGTGEPDEMNFIASLVNCSHLQDLGLNSNQLRGQLPNSVGNLSSELQALGLSYNFIYGSIPPSMMNLVGLQALSLNSNQFSGTIPSTVGNLQNLQVLFLEENSLSGYIPDSFGNLSLLNQLHLQNNSLEGTIPTTFGNCRNLILLNLSVNDLSGSIPKELLGLSSLAISLNLANNHFFGSLPQEVGNLQDLMELDLSENDLAGEVPNSIGSCTSLEYLNLAGNFFHGSITPSFGSLTGLQNLDLSRNNFSGQIPRFFEKFSLKILNLSFNDFEGEIPMEGVFANATALSIGGNDRLCGGIPELRLPKCSIKESKKVKILSSSLIVVIAIVCSLIGLVMVSFLLFCWLKKKSKMQPSVALPPKSILQISCDTLLKATNRFSSENLIGMGSTGCVYKGILEENGGMIAVKVLNLDLQGAPKSFMAECEAWRNIRHRNLVRIITACSSIDFQGNDFKALVYEFMAHGSLERWLHPSLETRNTGGEQHRLSLLERINIATDIAHAIDYLHNQCENTMIHCDLKPSNILLDKDMVAHVGDFGLARFLLPKVSDTDHSRSIGLRGTIGYAPPEYGLGSEMSAHGDVYSFGILLLEMITGKRPTNSMFHEGSNLHNYTRVALSDRITDAVDPILVKEIKMVETKLQNPKIAQEMVECIGSTVKIGVACSMDSPQDRMNISEVVNELLLIRNLILRHRK